MVPQTVKKQICIQSKYAGFADSIYASESDSNGANLSEEERRVTLEW